MSNKGIKSSEHIVGYSESKLAKAEVGDCVVRAIASTFELTYDVAHSWTASNLDRKPKRGTFNTALKLSNIFEVKNQPFDLIDKQLLTYPGSARHQKNKGTMVPITLTMFLELFPKGRYFVLIRSHAFSIVDGVVIGNVDDSNRMRAKIKFALVVTDTPQKFRIFK